MRTIDPGLVAHLAAGVTTLCHCWKLTRSDGVVEGFTDHDRSVVFDGVTYEPESGFDASEATSATGFAVGGLEMLGALSSERLSADDLAAGLYDGAEVRVFLVNWAMPAERHLLRTGHLGEVTREDGAFRAEIRGLAAELDQPNGRVFRHACDADLGDARCGINLATAEFRGTGAVTAATGRRRFVASGLGGFDPGWFERGRLVWTSGANAGRAIEVRAHRVVSGDVILELWQPMHFTIAGGDAFTVTAGCDKLFGTCVAKFHNGANFRGFPHMPGNDFALSYARSGRRQRRRAGDPVTRGEIVAEAVTWLGTPYRHQASLRGVGCDCLGLVRGVWRAFHGGEPEQAPAYTPDWAEASGVETLAEAAARHLAAIARDDADAGDVLLFRWRSNVPAKHAAILISPDRMIHAQQGAAVAMATLSPWWRRRIAFAFRFPGVTG